MVTIQKDIYCPHSDKWLARKESSLEHIIPLSLGGDNRLVLPVDRVLNCRLGHEIDGPLSNEFLLIKRRVDYHARGHSGHEPELVIKNARDSATGEPLQASWGRQLKLWDPKTKRHVPLKGQRIEASFKSNIIDLPLRFVAKAFLSAGYLAYGDVFRYRVDHEQARLVMKGPLALQSHEAASITARVYVPFTPDSELENDQLEEFKLEEAVCSAIKGSCVVLAPGRANLGAYVGVLGMYLGMINVPADTSKFPRFGDYDGGHAFVVSNGNVLRWSYRRLLTRIFQQISQMPRQTS